MYVCDACDFYFLSFGPCPRCGKMEISRANEEPNIALEDCLIEELQFDEGNWFSWIFS